MKDDKLNAVLDEVKQIKNRPSKESGGFLEFAESAIKMKKLFGWGAGGDDDEDEEEEVEAEAAAEAGSVTGAA